MIRRLQVILATAACVLGLAEPVMAQRPEMTAPALPSPYRGGAVVRGQITGIDRAAGTVTIKGAGGEVTHSAPAGTLEGVSVGDNVIIQSVPAGRSPSAVGGQASDTPPLVRVLPVPPDRPYAGLQYAPEAPPGVEPLPSTPDWTPGVGWVPGFVPRR